MHFIGACTSGCRHFLFLPVCSKRPALTARELLNPAQAAIERGLLVKQTRGAHRRAPRKSQPSCPIQSLQIFSKSCQEFALVFCPSSRQSKHYFQPKPHFRFPTPIRSQNRVYHSEKQNGIYTRNMLCIEKRDSI